MDPEEMIEALLTEIKANITLMKKAKKPEDKLIYSKVIKNLCSSFGEVIGVAKTMLMAGLDEFDDDFDDWDDDDDRTIPF